MGSLVAMALPMGWSGVVVGGLAASVALLVRIPTRQGLEGPVVDWGSAFGVHWAVDHLGRYHVLERPLPPIPPTASREPSVGLDGFSMALPARSLRLPERSTSLPLAWVGVVGMWLLPQLLFYRSFGGAGALDLFVALVVASVVVAQAGAIAQLLRPPPVRVALRGRVLRVGGRRFELDEDTQVALVDGRLTLRHEGEQLVVRGQMSSLARLAALLEERAGRVSTDRGAPTPTLAVLRRSVRVARNEMIHHERL